jgi:DNA polymerase III subunit gamma/tau
MDSFIVSARKYRPATFDMVVGQRSITATLKNAIRNKQLAQAFLFTGPRGVGKTTCARILAKTINCEHISDNTEACNACESCLSFNRSHSFNVHELDAASNNSVDGIRALTDQVRIPPQVGKYKVYIIDEVHMLSQAAFNAFLKTLEEPPAYAKFILATTERHKIIPTILSRCQIFDFSRITMHDMIHQLQYVAGQEGVTAEQEALHIIAQKADGAMRDALSIFDQMVSFSGNSITYKQVIESLNVLDYDYYFKVLDLILEEETAAMLLLIDEILQKGFEGSDFITGFGTHLRNLLVGKHATTVKLIESSDDVRKKYQDQASRCPGQFLLEALDINSRADVQYKTSSNKRLTLELALLQMMALVKKKPSPEQTLTKELLPAMTPAKKPAPQKAAEPSHEEKDREEAPAGAEKPPVIQATETAAPVSEGPVKYDRPENKQPSVVPAPSGKLPSGLSLKIHQHAAEEEDEGKEEETDPADLPGDEVRPEQFASAWKSLAESYEKESHALFLAMTKYEPLLNKDGLIVVFLDNEIQEDIFAERKIDLLSKLRKELNNYGLQMETRIKENGFQQKAYLPREKLQKLVEKNPLIGKLKKELDLDFDY